MSVTDQLLENSKRYAESFDKGDLPLPPAKKLAVVACMDARLVSRGSARSLSSGCDQLPAQVCAQVRELLLQRRVHQLAVR